MKRKPKRVMMNGADELFFAMSDMPSDMETIVAIFDDIREGDMSTDQMWNEFNSAVELLLKTSADLKAIMDEHFPKTPVADEVSEVTV